MDLYQQFNLYGIQAQLVSAVRTALDTSSGPVLLEAGLQLATKVQNSDAYISLLDSNFSGTHCDIDRMS